MNNNGINIRLSNIQNTELPKEPPHSYQFEDPNKHVPNETPKLTSNTQNQVSPRLNNAQTQNKSDKPTKFQVFKAAFMGAIKVAFHIPESLSYVDTLGNLKNHAYSSAEKLQPQTKHQSINRENAQKLFTENKGATRLGVVLGAIPALGAGLIALVCSAPLLPFALMIRSKEKKALLDNPGEKIKNALNELRNKGVNVEEGSKSREKIILTLAKAEKSGGNIESTQQKKIDQAKQKIIDHHEKVQEALKKLKKSDIKDPENKKYIMHRLERSKDPIEEAGKIIKNYEYVWRK